MTRRCQETVPLLGPLHDGELEPDDRAWVDGHLGSCANCATRSALLAATGAALRERTLAGAARADFSMLADRVMAKVGQQKRPSLAIRAETWGAEMWGAHRALLAGGASVALAAGLALAVVLTPRPPDEGAQIAQALADSRQTSVDEVDFGSQNGAVLQLPHETTVIWLADDSNEAAPQVAPVPK